MWALGLLLQTDYRLHLVRYVKYHLGIDAPVDGQFWNSPVFPRIAFCDYLIRALGNKRRYTAQCVLPLNIYLEQIYLIVWIWMALLLLITGVDLSIWTLRFLVRADRLHFIENQLHESSQPSATEVNDQMVASFLDGYLGQDGVFVLRLVAQNTSAVTSADITTSLWLLWKSRHLNDVIEDNRDDVMDEAIALVK